MKITLGRSGYTDCCLILHNGSQSKQYGVESKAWFILDRYWNVRKQHGEIPESIGLKIWNKYDNCIV